MWLDEWAARHGVTPTALFELRMQLGIVGDGLPPLVISGTPGSESRQQQEIRLDAARKGVWLTRNNVGAFQDERNIPVRYGLANESKQQNQTIKSADLIGMRSILIGPQHVGMVIAQFVSREAKREGWRFNPKDKHEAAQLAWMNFVLAKGGDAAFATGPGSFDTVRK